MLLCARNSRLSRGLQVVGLQPRIIRKQAESIHYLHYTLMLNTKHYRERHLPLTSYGNQAVYPLWWPSLTKD